VTAYERELDVVREVVLEAGELLRGEAKDPRPAHGGHNPVDAEIGARLVERLLREYPRDGVTIEEGAVNRAGTSGRAWVIDPHDGTSDFNRGRRETSISVALVDRGELVLGVVHAPVPTPLTGERGLLASWAKGEPLTKNGVAVSTPSRSMLEQGARVLLSTRLAGEGFSRNERAVAPAEALLCASIATRLALVAVGDADVGLTIKNGLADWDFAAGQALLRGAGGDLVGPEGKPIAWSGTHTSGTGLPGYFGARSVALAAEVARRYRDGFPEVFGGSR
jgi:fructose-1,6-bisphosphatase/inositol monophosphatase family enzyme